MKKKIEVKRKTVANQRDEVANLVRKDRVIFLFQYGVPEVREKNYSGW